MRIMHVVGARPNFMKADPVIRAIKNETDFEQLLLHTGQHYDDNLSRVFFTELGLPVPDIYLGVGSDSHARQTAKIMISFEEILVEEQVNLVLVYGDVNSTLGVSLVCAKKQVPIAHVEAGLRSFDRTMPEEINRIITDQLADILFTPSKDGEENLLREGVSAEKIVPVGNVMIDTQLRLLPAAEKRWPDLKTRFNIEDCFGLVTLHRPSNVDSLDTLNNILQTLNHISKEIPLIFPVHPRTRNKMSEIEWNPDVPNLQVVEPLGYLDFLALLKHSALAITDSGGIQEESTTLLVPCLTVRKNTERPITITSGTNTLVGQDMEKLQSAVNKILSNGHQKKQIPPLWDGKAGSRIAKYIANNVVE